MTSSDSNTAKNSADFSNASDIAAAVDQVVEQLDQTQQQIEQVIYGQRAVIEQSLITILAGGHGLLVGVPGLGKTLLVETMGTALGLDEKRIQFTPDLMPADILGSEILDENASGSRAFRFIKGPVFTQLLMADEINRASPRTQSALLQAMQEGRVSIAGEYHELPKPFHVLATQNPIEQEGTYPLPEAQLDRFLMQINIDYPDAASEREVILMTTGAERRHAEQVLNPESLASIQQLVRRVPVGEQVVDAILSLVRNCRPEASDSELVRNYVAWGPGPRASQALMLAARARALLEGRLAPSVDDIAALARPVLRHRMALGFAARAEGITIDTIISSMVEGLD